MTSVPAEKWEWFGLPGHFICGQWCRFHLCTKVGKYLVSSVGMYVHPRNSGASERTEGEWLAKNPNGEEIGCGRFYETFVFKAGPRCEAKVCNCGQPTIDGHELDTLVANDVGTATKNHMAMCQKWANR